MSWNELNWQIDSYCIYIRINENSPQLIMNIRNKPVKMQASSLVSILIQSHCYLC